MKKQHDTLIVLDFDHTLFNTTLFVEQLKKTLASYGILETQVDAARQAIKDCCRVVDIDNFIDALQQENFDELHHVVHDIIKEYAPSFIFSDVHNFITAHVSTHDILILTQGDTELQEQKIKHSNLPEGVQHIITTGTKDDVMADVVGTYSAVYLFEDKAKHIDEVKQRFPKVITYFIQRPEDKPYAKFASVCECADYVIENLDIRL